MKFRNEIPERFCSICCFLLNLQNIWSKSVGTSHIIYPTWSPRGVVLSTCQGEPTMASGSKSRLKKDVIGFVQQVFEVKILQERDEKLRGVCFYPEKREELKQKEESHFTMNNSYELISPSVRSRLLDIGQVLFLRVYGPRRSQVPKRLNKMRRPISLVNKWHAMHGEAMTLKNWRLWWKKGARFFTQKQTLSKMLQISHAALFRYVKQCSVCFFAEVCSVFEILRMQKSLYLWSRQHVTAKTVISLKIQQNIDLLQRVTNKMCWF